MSRMAAGLVMGSIGVTAGIPAFGDTPHPARQGTRLDELVPLIDPSLSLYNENTKERLNVRFFTPTGYDINAINQLNWMFRDWRQTEVMQVDVRVFWGLAAVRQAAMKDGDSGEIILTSGYRTKRTNDLIRTEGYRSAYNSFHMRARAADFKMPGAKVEDTARFVKWLQVGGTGYYPGRFVHMDSGDERSWIG